MFQSYYILFYFTSSTNVIINFKNTSTIFLFFERTALTDRGLAVKTCFHVKDDEFERFKDR